MAKEIVLRLTETEAQALYAQMYNYGEYVAAGAPMPLPAPGHELDLLRVFEDLTHQLGYLTMAEVMQAAMDRKVRGATQEHPE